MSGTLDTLAQTSQQLDRSLIWLLQKSEEMWNALARTASGEGVGGTGAVAAEPGPAIVLMAGGLTTLAAMMALFMARRSFSSTPDPVNTRDSRRRARESVDVYIDGDGNGNGMSADHASLRAESRSKNGSARATRDRRQAQVVSETRASTEEGEGAPDVGFQVVETVEPVAVDELEDADTAPGTPSLNAESPYQRGRAAGGRMTVSDAQEVLACLEAFNLGQPTLVRDTPNLYQIRLDGCRGCHPRHAPYEDQEVEAGCPFEAGVLEGAMARFTPGGVVVRESDCRRWGDEACVFEVWY